MSTLGCIISCPGNVKLRLYVIKIDIEPDVRLVKFFYNFVKDFLSCIIRYMFTLSFPG